MNYSSNIVIYGAYGYSAKLIIEELLKKNIKPICAGRDKIKLAETASQYQLESLCFDLSNTEVVNNNLRNFNTLLNCAGPFKFTSEILINSCLQTNTNYIDITGEIPAIEFAFSKIDEALQKGIVVFPSAGFDVIPTDCLSKRLSEQLPDANKLKMEYKIWAEKFLEELY